MPWGGYSRKIGVALGAEGLIDNTIRSYDASDNFLGNQSFKAIKSYFGLGVKTGGISLGLNFTHSFYDLVGSPYHGGGLNIGFHSAEILSGILVVGFVIEDVYGFIWDRNANKPVTINPLIHISIAVGSLGNILPADLGFSFKKRISEPLRFGFSLARKVSFTRKKVIRKNNNTSMEVKKKKVDLGKITFSVVDKRIRSGFDFGSKAASLSYAYEDHPVLSAIHRVALSGMLGSTESEKNLFDETPAAKDKTKSQEDWDFDKIKSGE